MLARKIEIAFDKVTKGKIGLREAYALDDRLDEREPQMFLSERLKDRETRWQDLSDELISRQTPAYAFLDDASFKFVIPAVMRWSLKEKNMCTTTAQYLFFLLLPKSRTYRQLFKLKDDLSLSPEQLRVLYEWLKLYLQANHYSLDAFESKQLAKWDQLMVDLR